MEVKYNLKGAQRKALVAAIGEIMECRPKYLGMPSAAYEIDVFTVDKEGTLHFDNHIDSMVVEKMLKRIEKAGFAFEKRDTTEETETITEPETRGAETDTADVGCEQQDAVLGFTVAMPTGYFKEDSFENLEHLIGAKGGLIKKALGIDSLPIQKDEEKVSFPWFEIKPEDSATVDAYTHFIYALCEMANNQKRISAKEKEVENEKYAFRCFLLRLGFIGEKYKVERKILLQNLTGSSAFKGGMENEISE